MSLGNIGINNNGIGNQQMAQKTTQQLKQIKVEDTKQLNRQKEGMPIEPLDEMVIGNEEIQQNNIQIVRNMEKMSETEQVSLTRQVINEFESSSQMQKERRISALKKAQRKEISQAMKEKDQAKINNVKVESRKRDTVEKLIRGSFLEQRLGMQKNREREDVTGHERRTRASRYAKTNLALPKTMDTDIDNLIQNMKMDMICENEYELDPRLTDMRKVEEHFKHVFTRRDKVLGMQRNFLDRKKEEPELTWQQWLKEVKGDVTVPEPTQSDKELKVQREKVSDVMLFTKVVTNNAGVTYEVYRSDLRAMERAKKQLEEDNAFQPSKYTTKLIDRLNERIKRQEDYVEKEYQNLICPAHEEEAKKKVKKLNVVCQKFSILADEIQEMRKKLEGLQGEKLEEEKKKVKDREAEIEKEVVELINNYRS